MEASNLCPDPTCDHSSEGCILFLSDYEQYLSIIVDDENGKAMVYASIVGDGSRIIKYDTESGKKSVIFETDLNIGSMSAWKQYIYFNLSGNNGETYMYRISCDGEESKLLKTTENDERFVYSGFWGDYMYLQDPDSFTLFRANEDFSVFEYIEIDGMENKNIIGISSRIVDGCVNYTVYEGDFNERDPIYCPRFDWKTMDYTEFFTYKNYAVYSVKIDEPNEAPRLISDRMAKGAYVDDGKMYLVHTGHIVIAVGEQKDQNGELRPTYLTNMCGGIKVVDMNTLEEEIIFEKTQYSVDYILYASDDNIIFLGSDEKSGNETGVSVRRPFLYNRKNGEFEVLY